VASYARSQGQQVETLRRGLALLAAFGPAEPELTLTDLAHRTRLPRPTVYRLLQTLVQMGFVEREPTDRRYRLGVGVARLGYFALHSVVPRDAAFPALVDLQRRTGETVSLGVLVGSQVVLVERLPSQNHASAALEIGSSLPAHCSAIGKVLLAGRDRRSVIELLRTISWEPRAPRTVTSLDALLDELDRALTLGLAFADEETEAGIRSVAAPIRAGSGAVVAGIAVSGATYHVTPRDLRGRLAAMCKAAADAISTSLGFRPDAVGGVNRVRDAT
jgi:IclR family pca regulon transcriptional regulator